MLDNEKTMLCINENSCEYNLKNIELLINKAIKKKVFPGCTALIYYNENIIFNQGFGNFDYNTNSKVVDKKTIYDLASLTKVIASVTAVMILKDKGDIDLDEKVSYYLPEFKGEYKDQIKIRNLLSHSSGLPPWKPLFEMSSDKDSLLEKLYKIPLEYIPGTYCDYSDLGFILLGEIIERITLTTLDKYCYEMIFKPLDMRDTYFCPSENIRNRIPPTEECSFRERVIQGEVHDENAFVMNCVSGHAGLFSITIDLAKFCRMILQFGNCNDKNLINPDTVREFTNRPIEIPECKWVLGWRKYMGKKDIVGDCFSDSSFGHLGYTGTSIWIDPVKELFIILLTNRVHPTRENKKILKFRPNFHNEILKSIKNISIV